MLLDGVSARHIPGRCLSTVSSYWPASKELSAPRLASRPRHSLCWYLENNVLRSSSVLTSAPFSRRSGTPKTPTLGLGTPAPLTPLAGAPTCGILAFLWSSFFACPSWRLYIHPAGVSVRLPAFGHASCSPTASVLRAAAFAPLTSVSDAA